MWFSHSFWVCKCEVEIFPRVINRLLQYHLLISPFFPLIYDTLVPYLSVILLCGCVCLFLWCHSILTPAALNSKPQYWVGPVPPCFMYKIVSAILGPLLLHMNFGIRLLEFPNSPCKEFDQKHDRGWIYWNHRFVCRDPGIFPPRNKA